MQLDDTICYCFHVSKRKIVNYIRVHRPRRASQVSACGGAGTGCGWCIPYLKQYFAEAQGERSESADALTPEEYAAQRAAYIRAGKGVPAQGAIPLPDEASGDEGASAPAGQ
ncbi:MAG: (2Fe-2S)-binding protein [Planctomycetota bacterium]|nr:MAG: (2Fe-2S)-binding protein [Planctomycetota bacterium]